MITIFASTKVTVLQELREKKIHCVHETCERKEKKLCVTRLRKRRGIMFNFLLLELLVLSLRENLEGRFLSFGEEARILELSISGNV